jgi:hypothetical protein
MTPVSPLLRRAILQKIQRVKMKWDSLTWKVRAFDAPLPPEARRRSKRADARSFLLLRFNQ